jgi:hypothetical protein
MNCLKPISSPDVVGAPTYFESNISDVIQDWEATCS